MGNKTLKFDLSPRDLKIKKFLNNEFLEIEIKAVSTANPNANGSHFTYDALIKSKDTFYNKPILGSFDVNTDDFGGHDTTPAYDEELDNIYEDNSKHGSEVPLGLIRQSDKVEIVQDPFDGLYWIKCTCALWTNYAYRQVKRLLRSGKKKISVEVEITDWMERDDGVLDILEFNLQGITILSDNLEVGIPGAHLKVLDYLESALFQKHKQSLVFAYQKLDDYINGKIPSKSSNFLDNNDDTTLPQKITDAIGMEEPTENEKVSEISMQNSQEKECNMEKILNDTQTFADEKFVDAPKGNGPDGNLGVSGNMSEEDKCPDCGKIKSECSCKDEKESCNDEKECDMSCDEPKDEKESCEDEKECNMSSEDKECKMSEDDCNEPCEEKESCDEPKKESEACDEKECDMSKEDKECDMSCDEPKTEKEGCHGPDVIELCGNTFTFESLAKAYTELNEKFTSVSKKLNEIEQDKFLKSAYSLVENESELSMGDKHTIKCSIYNYAEKNTFSTEDDAKSYAENLIAHAVYENIKNKKANKEKDFSVNINAEKVVISHSDNEVDSLKSAMDSLNKI